MSAKQSELHLIWDHASCTVQIAGHTENFDLAICMLGVAKREFTRRLNAAMAAQTLQISPSQTLPFLKHPH